jgi:predicted ester cyclase
MRNLNSSLLSRWFQEVWNNGNEKVIHELITGDAIAHGITDENLHRGPDGFKSFYNDFRNQFSNIVVTVDDVISQDDFEAGRCNVKAIHTESGRSVEFTGICMARIQNGKIAEAWNNFDFLKMYQQLGYKLVQAQA